MGMKLMKNEGLRTPGRRVSESEGQQVGHVPTLFAKSAKGMGHGFLVYTRLAVAVCLVAIGLTAVALAQGVSTTTVQGTVYLANGQPGGGTLIVSWPSFTTATGQAVAADSLNATIAPDGYVSVNLAPNIGATPAGEYYTAVFYMSDGTVNTQYWVVPAAAQATLAQVQAQIMPATQAVQTVSKYYVDEAITELTESLLTASGGTLSGPLILNADPTQALQAATKHYVDTQVASAVPLAGGNMMGGLTTPAINGVESPTTASTQTTLQSAINAAGTNGAVTIPPNYAGTDTFSNPNGVKVVDLRTNGSQQTERSVKEFGAVCDGVTDDTNALQAALTYANAHGVSLTLPEGTCKTRSLVWHGESIGGLGKQVSALMGFPGQDVLESGPDAGNMLSYTRLHDMTIYVDQSVDASCAPVAGRAGAGSCTIARPMEKNSIFSPGGNGLTGTVGTGAGWWVGNCAIAMQAATGTGGNGLRVAEIENVEIAVTGTDPMAAQYSGAHSTHTCGLYLAQWPQWSDFRNIDIRGVNTGVAIPALPVTAPAGLTADSNRWQNVTIQAAHAFTAAAGSNNVLDNVVANAVNSSATGETPTGLVLDLSGNAQGWTVRNAVVMPAWNAVAPALTVAASGGAVTAVTVGGQNGLGWDPYGSSVPIGFSGACTAQATATVNANGSIASVAVTQGGVGCSSTTTASVNEPGTWDTAAAVNLVGGQDMTLFAGNLLNGNGGYTVWNATNSASYGTGVGGGGGTLPGGGTYTALVRTSAMGSAFAVDQFPGADIGAKMQACVNALNTSYGGTCDARNFTGNQTMASNLTIATSNTTILLPCATITTANQIVVTARTRNVSLRGCALRGTSAASGSQGGSVFAYSGTGAMVQVGDPTYALDTPGFHMDNVAINTTAASSATAQGFAAYRTQEIDLESLYFLGNANQTGMTLDGTGNYTGGTFLDNALNGFGTAVNAIGHQVANAATTDWLNASTFVRLHIDCPTSGGYPIGGTYGINLQAGDGNTFTGGDVEGCATALHLGSSAQNNTIVGLRNENSTNQVVADTGSRYNNWMTGGTMYTGQLTDNGTRNSFLDTFHRSFNGLNGDWYGSQQDATVTNHTRLGIGLGNERGLQNEIQTDYGYRWEDGFTDGTSGEQFWNLTDLIDNVQRISVGQYLSGTANVVTNVVVNNGGCYTSSTAPSVGFAGGGGSGAAATANLVTTTSMSCPGGYTVGSVTMTAGGSGYTSQPTPSFAGANQTAAPSAVAEIATAGSTNNQTVINSAGTGAVVLNGSNGSGTGGVVFGSGGGAETTVGGIDASGNFYNFGRWDIYAGGTDAWRWNCSSTSACALQSMTPTANAYHLRAFNGGDTEIDSEGSSAVVVNNTSTSGTGGFTVYGGGTYSGTKYFSIQPNGTGGSYYLFPSLASSSGYNCLQVNTSGYITNTGAGCGSGGGGSGTVSSGSSGQIAYYTGNGSTVGGESIGTTNLADWSDSGVTNGQCPVWNSTTGKWTAANCGSGGYAGVLTDGAGGLEGEPSSTPTWSITPSGVADLQASITATSPVCDIRAYGAQLNMQDIGPYIQDCLNNIYPWTSGNTQTIRLECGNHTPGCYWANPSALNFTYGGPFRFELEGYLSIGSPLVTSGAENWFGIGPPGGTLQFQTGTPALIFAPSIYGTLGTAVTTPGQAVTVTPTFNCSGTSQNSMFGNCNIAYMPAGAAITIAGTTTATGVSATAVSEGYDRIVTLTLPSPVRYVPLETMTVSGCSDATLNITNGAIFSVSFSAPGGEQVVYHQSTTTTSTTATGCSITSFDEDKYESVRLFCSNGTNMPGYSYTCATGQWTIYPLHAHSASDVWGAVAVTPSFPEDGGHTFHDININGSYGMSYWGEQESNLDLYNVGMNPVSYLAAGGMEQTASWVETIGQLNYSPASIEPGTCEAGGCTQPSYPYGLRCDSESQGINAGGGSGTNTGCASTTIDGGAFIGGGIKIDGGGVNPITAMPYEIKDMLFEQAPSAAVVVDNRKGIDTTSCLWMHDLALQDNVTDTTVYYLAYTNQESPSLGCYKLDSLGTALTTSYTNPIFNDAVSIDRISYGTMLPVAAQSSVSSASPPMNDGRELQGAVRGSGAGFGPQVLPFGSLAIDNNPSDWASRAYPNGCASPNVCTVATTNVSCPDGPQASSKMACAEIDGPGQPINIGTWTGSTYAGDQFIYGCYVRPGAGFSFPQALQNQDVFMLYTTGTDKFPYNQFGQTNYTTPSYGFGTELSDETWYPLIGVATIATGESASHTINFQISSGNGKNGAYAAGYGNQFSDCRWAFIPGPNNPSYAGVTTDEVAFARDNQYRGAVPSNISAGTAATGETISASSYQVNGVALNAPSETYNASASGAIALPSADRAEATYVLSGSVTASIASGTGGGKVTVFICQPASGGPYTWTWPSNWKGGVSVGSAANTCSEQTGTYIAGFGDWHGDAGSTNVPQ